MVLRYEDFQNVVLVDNTKVKDETLAFYLTNTDPKRAIQKEQYTVETIGSHHAPQKNINVSFSPSVRESDGLYRRVPYAKSEVSTVDGLEVSPRIPPYAKSETSAATDDQNNRHQSGPTPAAQLAPLPMEVPSGSAQRQSASKRNEFPTPDKYPYA